LGGLFRDRTWLSVNLEALKGQTLSVTFEVDRSNNNKLVLSNRLATRSASFKLEPGQLVEGKITGIKPFGIFVDLDGVSGLLHIKQVSQNTLNL